MIKEVLQQLEPLDAQIDALCSRADDAEMANTTAHAAELAELSAEENALLQRCTSLTAEDRVFLARRPDRPHITEMIDALFTEVNPIPVKAAMNLLGMEAGALRLPLCDISEKNLRILRQAMSRTGLLQSC